MHIPAWIKLVLVILTLGILFGPGIQHHWKIARDPYFVPFDAVQYVPAFFKFDANDPVPTTYIKEYFLNAICPPLYKASVALGARVADVRRFQLGMMYLAYGLFVAVLGRLGWLLGGAPLSFAVMALTITARMYFGLGFIGGAPRMYGYPLMAVVIYALVRDHPRLLGLTAILGGLLYPIVAIVAGTCLTGWTTILFFARNGTVSRWSLRRRLTTLGVVGFLTLLALIPLFLGGNTYGKRILSSDIANYPEAGVGGNYRPFDQLPYELLGMEWLSFYVGPLYSHGDAIAPWLNVHKNFDAVSLAATLAVAGVLILLVTAAGLRLLLRGGNRDAVLRLLGFFLASGLLHIISWLVAPYLYIPVRYFLFSLPFVITLMFPWALYAVVSRFRQTEATDHLPNIIFLMIVGMYLIAFGDRGNVEFEKDATVHISYRPLYELISRLPNNSTIAGWPLGEIRSLEYVTRRNIFLTAELHQVLHRGFADVMRQRMDALFDAYLSIDPAPLRRLRDQFGVTHLLVETHHFTDPKRPPEYFAPWRSRIGPRLDAIKNKVYLIDESLRQKAAVYDSNGLILLDLARLP